MSKLRRFEIIEHSPSYSYETKTSIYRSSGPPPKTLALLHPFFPIVDDDEIDLFSFTPPPPFFDTITDLIQIDQTPLRTSTRRVTRRVGSGSELYLQTLSDRVSDLELGFEKLLKKKKEKKKEEKVGERKYTWTAEIKSPEKERKYKWTAEKKGVEKSYKWTAEIKGKGDDERKYTIEVSSGGDGDKKKEKTKKKNKAVEPTGARVVEIDEEEPHHGAIVLRQVSYY